MPVRESVVTEEEIAAADDIFNADEAEGAMEEAVTGRVAKTKSEAREAVIQVDDWFHKEPYQNFSCPNFTCPSSSRCPGASYVLVGRTSSVSPSDMARGKKSHVQGGLV